MLSKTTGTYHGVVGNRGGVWVGIVVYSSPAENVPVDWKTLRFRWENIFSEIFTHRSLDNNRHRSRRKLQLSVASHGKIVFQKGTRENGLDIKELLLIKELRRNVSSTCLTDILYWCFIATRKLSQVLKLDEVYYWTLELLCTASSESCFSLVTVKFVVIAVRFEFDSENQILFRYSLV